MEVACCEAFRLHKFTDAKTVAEKVLKKEVEAVGSVSPMKSKVVKPLVSDTLAAANDEYFSAYVPGILQYMKFMQQNHSEYTYNLEKVAKKLIKTDSKRSEIKRTLIGYQKSETLGYRLEKLDTFQFDLPVIGNNYYKNHSQIGKHYIYRKYKGPLYNDAGRICIDLTSRYLPLESFKYET